MIEASSSTSFGSDRTLALGRADRFLPLLLLASIAVGLAIGLVSPTLGTALAGAVSLGVFALIYVVMLGVGAGGVRHILAEPRFVAIAVVLNFVVNPILAWILGLATLTDSRDLKIGLLLFLVTPCVGWFLIFTDLAGGDTGLGIGMLGVNLVLQIALLPLYLGVFVGEEAGVPLSVLLRSVAIFLVAPTVAARLTRAWSRRVYRDRPERRPDAWLAPIKATLLAIIIVSMFASQAAAVVGNASILLRLVVPLVVFFVVVFSVALIVGRVAGLPPQHTTLLAFTTTSRNSEVSLAIAATVFASPLVGLTVVLGPVIELPLLVAMVYVLKRHKVGIARDAADASRAPHRLP